MITKIVLENFMAHEHTELELGPGVNALTGPNNTGKSAIVEALRCVSTNPVPKHYIRHGAKEARVGLEFTDGTRVVWVRKKRSSGYELWHPGAEEPEEYWKFGRRPPEDILAALKLDLVELETGGEIDVHVGNQREPVFLLNQPGSNAAAFFAASTESAHLLAMQNVLKRRTQDAKRQERELKGRLTDIEGKMENFSPLPDIGVELEAARELESAAKRLQSEMPVLENVLTDRKNLSDTLAIRKVSATVLNLITPAPKLIDTNELSQMITQISGVEGMQDRAEQSASKLASLQSVPQTHDTTQLATVYGQLQGLGAALDKGQKSQAVAGVLSGPPELENTSHLSNMMDEIIALTFRGRRGFRWQEVLQSIVEPPDMVPSNHLESLLGEIHGLAEQKRRVEVSQNELESRLDRLKMDIKQRVEAIGCCPTCGADISGDDFLDRRCRHDA